MSADNYYEIWKGKDGKFRAYMKFASCDYPDKKPTWKATYVAKTMEEMIEWVQGEYTEYGYHFANI